MNCKKFVLAVLLILAFIYAVRAAMANPGTREWIIGFAEEHRLLSAVSRVESGSSGAQKSDGSAQSDVSEEKIEEDDESETSLPPFPSDVTIPDIAVSEPQETPVILPTTIEGGMVVNNNTSYELDLEKLVSEGTSVKLASEGPQVLIIHTHGSEAYTPDITDDYASTDDYRTEDPQYSVIRVGDELASCLESYGISVIHDRSIYDYPSYTGSYRRSGAAIEEYLKEYPGISVILDVHRDAIGDGDVVYKTMAEAGGKPCSQLMLLVGTGENGLEHLKWQENLKFALMLQSAVVAKHPSLARPIALKKERYNQHLTTGSLILEVGSSGNTLSEALNAVRLFADAVAPVLKELK